MKSWQRPLLKAFLGIIVLDLIWYGSTKSYLNSESFFKRINTPRLQFTAVDGYSPWPGYFVFHDFAFTGFSRQTTYQVLAKTVSFRINLLNLARRHVSINGLKASDVRISVDDGPEGDKDPAAAQAEDREEQAAQDEAKEERKGRKKQLWVTEFSGASFDNVSELRLLSWVWSGKADFDASFKTDNEKHFSLEDFEASSGDLKVTRDGREFATIDRAKIKISIDEFLLNDRTWKSLLPKIRSQWQVKGKLDRVESLAAYTKDLDWFALSDTALTMEGDFGIKDGRFVEGSNLRCEAQTLHIDLLNQSIIGPATLAWSVKETNHVELTFGEFSLNKGRDGSGQGFSLILDTPEKEIIPEWKTWDAHVSIPKTEVHRLQFVQQYIPASLPLTLEKGQGYLLGEFHASSDPGRSKGSFDLKVTNVQADYKEKLRFTGAADAKIKISRIDPQKGDMNIADAGIDITDLDFLDKKNWRGSLHFTEAYLRFEKPNVLTSSVALNGDNLQPVLAFLIKDKSFPEFLMRAFDLKQPKVTFKVAAKDKALQVRDFDAKAGDLALHGWFDQKLQNARARFLIEYAGLSGGYGFDGEKIQWKLTGAKDWYNKERQDRL